MGTLPDFATWSVSGHGYPGIHGRSHVTPAHLAVIVEAVPEGGRYLEIGVAEGATLAYVARARSKALCLGNDPYRIGRFTQQSAASAVLNFRSAKSRMLLLIGTAADVRELIPGPWDVILIDGSHFAQNVLSDLTNAQAVLSPTGTIFAHDYGAPDCPQVQPAVDAWLAGHPALALARTVGTLAVIQWSQNRTP
jgi:predicted O-methyltransferase YrrM